MITLKEALKVTKISEDEILYIRKKETEKYQVEILTLKEIRNKYDMKNIIVTGIQPRFLCGNYHGMEFEIKKKKEENNV